MVLVDWKDIAMAGQTSDIVIQRDIQREVIYRKADLLSVGTKLLPLRNFGVLDVKFEFPSEFAGEYPVPEGAMAKLEKIVWTPFNVSLEKCQVHYLITDEAKARQLADYQRQVGMKRAAEAMAKQMDQHILDMIIAGANTSNLVTVGGGDEWNSGGADVDIDGNVGTAINNILSNSNVSLEDIANINMVVPAPVYGELKKLHLIGNVQQKFLDYFKSVYGLSIYPTRYTDAISGNPAGISDDAYIVVYTDDAGITGSFEPAAGMNIPLTEERRAYGSGDETLFTRYFKTKIQPLSSTVATSRLIARIANVC
jgi:hypothetical protein